MQIMPKQEKTLDEKDIRAEFRDCFFILMNGARDEFKNVKKRIEKLWHLLKNVFVLFGFSRHSF